MSDWEKRYLGWGHFPVGLDEAEIAVFFALGEADLAAIRTHPRDPNRLAIAIQIGYIRMTGVALNSVQMIPPAVLAYVAGQVGQTPPQLTSIRALYRRRRRTLLARGEAVHTLQRAIHDGPITAAHGRSSEELVAISGALTLIANLVIFWNARNIDAIVAEAPDQFDQTHLARIAPIAHAHINMRGILRFNIHPHRDALLDHGSKSAPRP